MERDLGAVRIRMLNVVLVMVLLGATAVTGCRSSSATADEKPTPPDQYSSEEIDCRIVDSQTGEPVIGAAVAVTWDLRGGMHSGFAKWLMLGDTITERDGSVRFPAWGPLPRPRETFLWTLAPQLRIFKTGYKPFTEMGSVGSDVRRPTFNHRDIRISRLADEKQELAAFESLEGELRFAFFRESCAWERLPRYLGAVLRESQALARRGLPGVPDLAVEWRDIAKKYGCRDLQEVLGVK